MNVDSFGAVLGTSTSNELWRSFRVGADVSDSDLEWCDARTSDISRAKAGEPLPAPPGGMFPESVAGGFSSVDCFCCRRLRMAKNMSAARRRGMTAPQRAAIAATAPTDRLEDAATDGSEVDGGVAGPLGNDDVSLLEVAEVLEILAAVVDVVPVGPVGPV
ncbi:hypothetical protein DFJ73DRAFT_864421, partial [Zopfochytrium polystomum]